MKDKLVKAKHMFFSDISVVDIASELDMDINELGYLIFGADKSGHSPSCWYQERTKLTTRSFITYQKVKPYILSIAESKIAKLIEEGADSLESIGNIDDMNKAVDVLSKLDKLGRLERGETTENVEVSLGFNLREISNGVRIVEDENNNNKEIEDAGTSDNTRGIPSPRPRSGE